MLALQKTEVQVAPTLTCPQTDLQKEKTDGDLWEERTTQTNHQRDGGNGPSHPAPTPSPPLLTPPAPPGRLPSHPNFLGHGDQALDLRCTSVTVSQSD